MENPLSCTLQQFKNMCKELIDAAPTLDDDGFGNAVNCLNLGYLNLEGSDLDLHQANYTWQLTLREVNAIERISA